MKSYSNTEEHTNFRRLSVPTGRALPHSPVPGEMFVLELDMEETHTMTPWYSKGVYVFDGIHWNKLNDSGRQRKASVIGAQMLEVDHPTRRVGMMMDMPAPSRKDGFDLCAAALVTSNIRASVSGTASFWVDSSLAANLCISVFRDDKLVALAVEMVEPNKPRTVSISFNDVPRSIHQLLYTLKVSCDSVCHLYINKSDRMSFDGICQTAFIVEENN